MRIIRIENMPSNHEMGLSGDDHDGSLLCHHDGLEQLVDWTAKKNNYLIKMGDAIEAIMTDDKRFDRTSQAPSIPLQQADGSIERYKPVRKKIKGWLSGNHENKLHRFGNLSEYMANGLGVPYGTYTAVFEVYDRWGLMYRIFASHGFGVLSSNAKDAEQRKANMLAALKMRLKWKRADCIIQAIGHTHKLLVCPPTGELYLTTENGKTKQHYMGAGDPTASYIHPDQRWYVNTGSFLKLYGDDLETSGYGELKGYDPVELGFAKVIVRDRVPVDVERVVL